MTRSNEYEQGYRAAWRDAIAHVHSLGDRMNEVKAKHCIYGVAFSLGNLKGFNVPPFAPDKEPSP